MAVNDEFNYTRQVDPRAGFTVYYVNFEQNQARALAWFHLRSDAETWAKATSPKWRSEQAEWGTMVENAKGFAVWTSF